MKLGAIDLGSNSIHLVMVEVRSQGQLGVIGREKEMVRLGASTLAQGRLSRDAMDLGLATLRRFLRLAEGAGVEKVLAVATSAVREASNGEAFLERIGAELGLWARAISGEEEARLVYLAALHALHLEGRRTLLIDVGGGSVELAVGSGPRVELATSLKLGVLRLADRLGRSDPLSAKDLERLSAHVRAEIAPLAERVRKRGFERAVGTSGTILALGALAREQELPGPQGLHHVNVTAAALRRVRDTLLASDLEARRRMPQVGKQRADLIVAGAVLLDTLLEAFGVEEVTLCEWALREGVLLDYVETHRGVVERAEAFPDVRLRSVLGVGERYRYDATHARQVARLALGLFDGTRGRHGLGDAERALLEYAALLHDVGRHVAYPAHHKHSYYLIKNAALRGFDPLEVELVAQVARYHRRSFPRRRHAAFDALPGTARRSVRVLAGCLRLAEALDRGHRQVVRGLTVRGRGERLTVQLEVDGDPELELWGAARRVRALEEALDSRLRLEAGRPAEGATPRLERSS